MTALLTALIESETKESLAAMVCELREESSTASGMRKAHEIVAEFLGELEKAETCAGMDTTAEQAAVLAVDKRILDALEAAR